MKRTILIGLMILCAALSLYGIDFGLPNHEHAYPYNPDEWTPMQCLQSMNPRGLDFNPHYFDAPTLPFYLWGATFAAAHVAGYLRVDGTEKFYFEHPEHLARMLLLGRLWSIFFGMLCVWLVYILARRLGASRGTGLLAALLMALHPSATVQNHFMKVNPMVTFLMMSTILAADHWVRRGDRKGFVWTGVLLGISLATKYSALLLLPVLVLAAFLRYRRLRLEPVAAGGRPFRSALAGITGIFTLALAVFIAGSPYMLIDFRSFAQDVSPFGEVMFRNSENTSVLPLPESLRHVTIVHMTAQTPILLLLSLPGLVLLLRRPNPLHWLIFAHVLIFFAATLRAGYLATGSRFLPLYPATVILATLSISALLRKSRPLGLGVAALTVVVMGFWTGTLVQRFTGPMPQEQASAWARENLGERTLIFLQSKAVYWNPDFPLREFLQAENRQNYERRTDWRFVRGRSYESARPQNPEVVFLTAWLPRSHYGMEWLTDPEYEVIATFPGKVSLFGKRFPVWVDFYDVDIWVLKRRDA